MEPSFSIPAHHRHVAREIDGTSHLIGDDIRIRCFADTNSTVKIVVRNVSLDFALGLMQRISMSLDNHDSDAVACER